jgi:hypothetical protein
MQKIKKKLKYKSLLDFSLLGRFLIVLLFAYQNNVLD